MCSAACVRTHCSQNTWWQPSRRIQCTPGLSSKQTGHCHVPCGGQKSLAMCMPSWDSVKSSLWEYTTCKRKDCEVKWAGRTVANQQRQGVEPGETGCSCGQRRTASAACTARPAGALQVHHWQHLKPGPVQRQHPPRPVVSRHLALQNILLADHWLRHHPALCPGVPPAAHVALPAAAEPVHLEHWVTMRQRLG
jgi:hypothetical protein